MPTAKLTTSYQYAAAAATGLSASVSDLVSFTQAQLHTDGKGASLLSRANVDSMCQPHGRKFGLDIWGLGVALYAPTTSGNYIFGHDGSNAPAINTSMRINPDNGDAIMVLVTGNPSLASSIGYEWTLWQTGIPDFLMIDKAVQSAIRPLIVGYLFITVVCALLWVRRRRGANTVEV